MKLNMCYHQKNASHKSNHPLKEKVVRCDIRHCSYYELPEHGSLALENRSVLRFCLVANALHKCFDLLCCLRISRYTTL